MMEPGSGSPGETYGRYQLLERIGRGGMAEVFKAKSFGVEGFEKVLVIKRIVPELAVHQQFVEMFVQEAKLAVQLSHANIVQVFDLGRIEASDGPPSYFIAMEYVPGVDLATFLQLLKRQKQQASLELCSFVISEVAKALDHAHRRSDASGRPLEIVHRDISPQNILLSWDGDVKVTDFGIAKAADAISAQPPSMIDLEAARATGKIAFMSPEQSKSEHTDARSDLFSLGTVMYELLTGANPFHAPTLSETARRIQAGEYPPLALARPDVPSALVAIVDGLLEADRAERMASAQALGEQLLAFSYTAGWRFDGADLAALLAPLRPAAQRGGAELDIEAASVFDEPQGSADKTPVEIPHASSPPPPQSSPETGERREVTVLVVAFGGRRQTRGSAEQLSRARDVLDRHGGWIEEQTPAQIVAIFGLGDTDGRDAEAAVRAALVLVRDRRFAAVPSAGVHSGALSVDDGGIPVHDERLASLLSVAQTLARATEAQVALSPVAARLVRRSFVTEPLPESGRMVTDGGLVVRRPLATEVARSRFVGRVAELKRLGQILALATRRQPQLAVVKGETGLGKTRLLSEAKRRLERGQFNVAFYAASCPANGASVAWSGLRAMLHVLCGTQEDDDPQRILEVRPRLRALGLRDEQAGAVLTLLGAPQRTPDSEMRAFLRASFERMVASLCRDRLHCFAWDDAQAIDKETLEAILRILRHHKTRPARGGQSQRGLAGVFLLAQRGELPPALEKRSDAHLLELAQLTEGDTARLMESQLGARAVPDELLGYVMSCAGGHPLFVEELLRELCDSGVVQVLSGNVTMAVDAQARAPRTLRTLIAERVSRLQQRERRVLQGLAILGEPAFTPVLSSVLELPLPSLDRHLGTLEQRGLLRRTGPTQVRFASPLYEEIVLDAMPAAVRQELHGRAADTYGGLQLPGAGEAAERIADHLLGAGERARATEHFWRSAEEKLGADQLEAALRSMIHGLSIADPETREPQQLTDWIAKIAGAVTQVRKASGLREVIAPALREIDARGDRRERTVAHIHAARALGSVNLFEEAYNELDAAGADDIADPLLLRDRLTAESEVASRQGLFTRAIEAGEKLERLGLIETDAEALMALALARAMTGDCDAAIAVMERVRALGEPKDALEAVVRQKHRTLIFFNKRDFDAAAREGTELATLARAAGLRFDTAAALHNLGDIYDRLGDHPRAYAAFVESIELTRLLEHDRLTNLNQMHLCLLDGLRSPEGAEERLKGLIRYADAHGFLWDVLEGRYLLARLCAAHGDHERARKHLGQVMEMADRHSHKLIFTDAELLHADLKGDSFHPR
jgi:serine/threonine protein kinase/tetratricopeptide (TPR) repeat protein